MPPIRMVHCGTLLSSSHALVFKGAVCSKGVAHTNQWWYSPHLVRDSKPAICPRLRLFASAGSERRAQE